MEHRLKGFQRVERIFLDSMIKSGLLKVDSLNEKMEIVPFKFKIKNEYLISFEEIDHNIIKKISDEKR